MTQPELDAAIQRYYRELFDEHARLTTRSAQGRLEFERTQEIVRSATPAPARILDVGGATGIHAAALADAGYDVTLVDPVPEQVAAAARVGTFATAVGDARDLQFEDEAFDAVLMAGPLYYLSERADRLTALKEARRVTRVGGVLHAAAIPRFLAFAVATLIAGILDAAPEAGMALLQDGTPPPTTRFPAGHFHTPAELADEMRSAGLAEVTVVGLEGPAALALEIDEDVTDDDVAAAGRLARSFAHDPVIGSLSCHILGTGRVP